MYNDKDRIQNLKIKNITLITDRNKNPLNTIQRNNLFIHELSPVLCYQTMFGYKSEFLPSKNLTFEQIDQIGRTMEKNPCAEPVFRHICRQGAKWHQLSLFIY